MKLLLTLAVAGMLVGMLTGCNPNSIDSPVAKVIANQAATNSCFQTQLPARTNLPAGYGLQINQDKQYRAIWIQTKTPLSVIRGYDILDAGTKQEAIASAWSLYEYNHKNDNVKWEDVK